MLIGSDVERTSAAARSLEGFSPWHPRDDSFIGTSEVLPVFLQRKWFGDLAQNPVELSGMRVTYDAQITINGPSATAFISAGGGRVQHIFFDGDRLRPLHIDSSVGKAPVRGSWLETSMFQLKTLGYWPPHDDLGVAISALRDVVSAIENRSPFRLSDDTERLLHLAAGAHGAPTDIASWARRLAQDVRDLPD